LTIVCYFDSIFEEDEKEKVMKEKFPVKRGIKIGLLVLFLMIIVLFKGYSQKNDQNMIDVYGQLTSELGQLNSAKIKIKEDDFEWLNVKFNKRTGEFNLALPVGHTFLFSFTQEGTIAKQISFSTKTPEEYENVVFDPFFFMVNLEDYTNTPEIDTLFYKEPVGKIFFSEEFIKFDYDRDYNLYVKNRIAQVRDEMQLKQQLLAQQTEQRRLDSIVRKEMLSQTQALKDTLISADAFSEDTVPLIAVTEVPDTIGSWEDIKTEMPLDKDTVLLANMDTASTQIPVESEMSEQIAEVKPDAEMKKIEPEEPDEKPVTNEVEVQKTKSDVISTPNRSTVVKKPEPVPVAIGKQNGREFKYFENEDVQVTKIFITRSKKTIIYSMYQYRNGNTKYYKQQPLTNDSIQVNRDIFTRSIR
jgi:hypothetical protein